MPMKKVLRQFGILVLIIANLAFIVTIVLSTTLTKPLRNLVEAMQRIGQGQTDQTRLQPSSTDEIGVLTVTFNEMNDEISQSRQKLENINKELEEKVKARTQELEEMAIRDALTGLYNRRYFNQRIKEELSRAKRYNSPLGFLYLDLDHFKKYNDNNGHLNGDNLLKQFSDLLKATVRTTDVPARLGGEEFCVILPETDIPASAIVAEKIRAAVEQTPFPFGEKQPLGKVSCSIGVSGFPQLGQDEASLVQIADEALYVGKESGRNSVFVGKLKQDGH